MYTFEPSDVIWAAFVLFLWIVAVCVLVPRIFDVLRWAWGGR